MNAKTQKSLFEVAAVCDLLSDEIRMRIVLSLAQKGQNVSSLIKLLGVRQPLVSHHLGLLRMSRLVVATRKGKQVFYTLAENVRAAGGKLKITLPTTTVTLERR